MPFPTRETMMLITHHSQSFLSLSKMYHSRRMTRTWPSSIPKTTILQQECVVDTLGKATKQRLWILHLEIIRILRTQICVLSTRSLIPLASAVHFVPNQLMREKTLFDNTACVSAVLPRPPTWQRIVSFQLNAPNAKVTNI